MRRSVQTPEGYTSHSIRVSSVHVPGLDGLRGLAILAVIIVHVMERVPLGDGVEAVVSHVGTAGWIGVDLFFVLSGFLITGILLDQRGKDNYFRTFYSRRALRIVPAYVVFLAFSLWIAPLVGLSTHAVAEQLRATQGWYWTYSSNIYFALHGFPPEGAPLHLWSLAVEEQFYLLWPFAVAVVAPRALPRLAIGCMAVALLCRIAFIALSASSDVIYVLLPTRMDALAVGAFLACAVRDPALLRRVSRCRVPVLIAVVLFLAAEAVASRRIGEIVPVTLLLGFLPIAFVSGYLLLLVVDSKTLLTNSILRVLGRYSYAMYLWHLMVLRALIAPTSVLAARRIGGSYLPYYILVLSAVLATTLLVALASWYLVEQPFLRLKHFFPYGRDLSMLPGHTETAASLIS